MLQYLDEKSKEHFGCSLLLPSASKETIVTNRSYAEVTPLYKYGCAGCNGKERNEWFHLCDQCKTSLESEEWLSATMAHFDKRVAELQREELPDLGDSIMRVEGEDLTCHVCSRKFNNAADYGQHCKQFHPDSNSSEKGNDIRSKSKYGST